MKVHLPVPFFVTPPLVFPIILAIEHAVAVPANVNVNVAPVIVPGFVIVIFPVEGAEIVLALPSVISPL